MTSAHHKGQEGTEILFFLLPHKDQEGVELQPSLPHKDLVADRPHSHLGTGKVGHQGTNLHRKTHHHTFVRQEGPGVQGRWSMRGALPLVGDGGHGDGAVALG